MAFVERGKAFLKLPNSISHLPWSVVVSISHTCS